MIVFLHDCPSAAWVARELAAGRAIDIRCDCRHGRDHRDALHADHRDHQAATT